jgi:hypothetical protein
MQVAAQNKSGVSILNHRQSMEASENKQLIFTQKTRPRRSRMVTMASAPVVLGFVLVISPAFAQPPLSKILARVSEEAEVLQQNAPRILTQETLQQRALMPPSRFRPRNESEAAGADSRLRVREIVSEYSFGALSGAAAHNLLEFRQVISVDGRAVQTLESARRALLAAIQSADDRARKRMLEDFAKNGLVDIATDYGLILLMFGSRSINNIKITPLGTAWVGTEEAMALSWQQTSSSGGALEFHGRESVRRALRGTLWVRASDGLPLRVNAWMEYTDPAKHVIRDDASVEYILSAHGFLAPASVVHRHLVDGRLMTENLYRYEPFKLFAASSDIKFTDPATPPAPIKK